jgi:hypothetical protein
MKRMLSILVGIMLIIILVPASAGCIPEPAPAPIPAPTPAPMPSAEVSTGFVEVHVTDAPPEDNVTSIMVTVSEVEIHKAVAEQEQEQEQSGSDNQTQEQEQQQTQQGEGEWITIDISDDASTFDLLKIKGIEQFLATSEVEAGKYTQVRLAVETVEVALGDGELEPATLPSNELKFVRPFDVVAGETTVILLDFDAEKSVTVTGSGKILVKPVVKLTIKPGESKGKPEEAEEKEAERQEFEGIIDTIDGDIWTMTVEGESWTVDVSEAEIDGEPEVGLEAEVKGTVVDDTIVASEVEIEEEEEPE